METRTIEVKCSGSGTINYTDLIELQGALKELPKENLEKLKNEIVTTGFAFPFHIWRSKKQTYIIGGHQRLRAIRSLAEDGFTIPSLPVVEVFANDLAQAKRRVLQDVSQYGHIDKAGLIKFIESFDLSKYDLLESFDLPNIDIETLESDLKTLPAPIEAKELPQPVESDIAKGEQSKLVHTCPQCGHKFTAP